MIQRGHGAQLWTQGFQKCGWYLRERSDKTSRRFKVQTTGCVRGFIFGLCPLSSLNLVLLSQFSYGRMGIICESSLPPPNTHTHTVYMLLIWGAKQIISHKAFYPYIKWETMPILLIWLSVWLDRMIIGWMSKLLEETFMVPRQRFPKTSTLVTARGWHLWFWVARLNSYWVDFSILTTFNWVDWV